MFMLMFDLFVFILNYRRGYCCFSDDGSIFWRKRSTKRAGLFLFEIVRYYPAVKYDTMTTHTITRRDQHSNRSQMLSYVTEDLIRGEVKVLGKSRFRGWETNVVVMCKFLLSGHKCNELN